MFFCKNKINKKPPFIKVLEYGEVVGLNGTNETEFLAWSKENDFATSNESEILSRFLYRECFQHTALSISDKKDILKNEYYFRLIEYRELQEARKASSQANRNSWIAIILSIIAIGITSYLAWTQMNNPVKLHSDTIKEISQELKRNGTS